MKTLDLDFVLTIARKRWLKKQSMADKKLNPSPLCTAKESRERHWTSIITVAAWMFRSVFSTFLMSLRSRSWFPCFSFDFTAWRFGQTGWTWIRIGLSPRMLQKEDFNSKNNPQKNPSHKLQIVQKNTCFCQGTVSTEYKKTNPKNRHYKNQPNAHVLKCR